MGWMGGGSFEAWMKTTDPTYIDNFSCRSHTNPAFMDCSMIWTGGYIVQSLDLNSLSIIQKDDFSHGS
jgi:hypothetical protein